MTVNAIGRVRSAAQSSVPNCERAHMIPMSLAVGDSTPCPTRQPLFAATMVGDVRQRSSLVKIVLVGFEFMELRKAPRLLRAAFSF